MLSRSNKVLSKLYKPASGIHLPLNHDRRAITTLQKGKHTQSQVMLIKLKWASMQANAKVTQFTIATNFTVVKWSDEQFRDQSKQNEGFTDYSGKVYFFF